MKRLPLVVLSALLLAVAVVPALAAEGVPTFTTDVAPILYDNCVVCHREGEVAPMSLMTYSQVRPWSRAIKEKVVSRVMPPWHADPRFGEFRNARGLTQDQINTIVEWVNGGAPKGPDADLPQVPVFPKGWTGGEPDYVVDLPVEFVVPAQGEMPELDFYTPLPFTEDRFVEALEMRPTNPAVVHHAGTFMATLPDDVTVIDGVAHAADGTPLNQRQIRRRSDGGDRFITPGASKLLSYVPGRGYEAYSHGAAKRLTAGAHINFEMHYNSTGREETDQTKLGLWFAKGPVTHEIINSLGAMGPSSYIVEGAELRTTDRGSGRDLPVIPPYAEDWQVISVTAVQNDVTVHGLTPHLHLRGKSMTYVATYPNGENEVLLSVPKYDFNWQHYYDLVQPKKLPAGSKLTVFTSFDNSIKNRYNPAPDKEVYWGEQSWDEMYSPQVRITVDQWDLTKMKPATEEE